jgi:hypothetical protein
VRDERFIHIGNGMAVLGEPLPKLLASTQRPSDTVGGIPLLVQGRSEAIQVSAQRPVPQAGDHRGACKAMLDHRLLLFSEGERVRRSIPCLDYGA